MSNRNYTNYSKPAKQAPRPEPQEQVTEPVEPAQEVEEIVEPKKPITGVVANCFSLNVRTGPSKDFDVVCEIPSKTEVQIDESGSSDDFYKICTATGIEGFCMKAFIEVRE